MTPRVAIQKVFDTLITVLREIFDEAAYERFLASNQLASTAEAYSDFLSEQEQSRARRPRCC